MIKIDKDALYSRADLAELLKTLGIDVDNFIRRIKPHRFLKKGYLGYHIISAMRAAPGFAPKENEPKENEALASKNNGNGKAKKNTQAERPRTKMDAFIKSFNGKTTCCLWLLATVFY